MVVRRRVLPQRSVFVRFGVLLAFFAVLGCTTLDPALRQAIAEAERDPNAGRIKLLPFAEKGDPAATVYACALWGRALDTRYLQLRERYFAVCQQAAATGDAEAQFYLGRLYEWEIGTPKDLTQALAWYRKAASQGHEKAEDSRRAMEGLPPICKNSITHCRMF
jgi:TPR repeat protein